MLSVVVGWRVYQLTHDALSPGLIWLVVVLPFLSVLPLGGHIADVLSRRRIVLFSRIVYVAVGAKPVSAKTVEAEYEMVMEY